MTRARFPGAVALLAALALASGARAEVDPFYTGLLRDGAAAISRGDYPGAARTLRIACFGLLEDPPQLAACLVRLGLAQAAEKDSDDFIQTFDRLALVEQRFGVYSGAALTDAERRDFEARAMDWIPPVTLSSIPAFARLVTEKEALDLARLSPRERRKALEKKIAAAPAEPLWRAMLAELELDDRRPQDALNRLGALPASTLDGRVGCDRALAFAALDRCADAVPAFASCAAAAREERLALPWLDCLVAAKRGDDARRLAASLPPELGAKPEVKKRLAALAAAEKATVEKAAAEKLAAEKAAAEKAAAESRSRASAAVPVRAAPAKPDAGAAKSKPVPLPAAPREKPRTSETTVAPGEVAGSARLSKLESDAEAEARRLLASATSQTDLRRADGLARPVADAHPERRDAQFLAAEIAYRATQWSECATYFRRGGDPGDGEPLLRFYMAVCLYETGDRAGARKALEGSVDRLKRTPYVEGYLRKIFPDSGGGQP